MNSTEFMLSLREYFVIGTKKRDLGEIVEILNVEENTNQWNERRKRKIYSNILALINASTVSDTGQTSKV